MRNAHVIARPMCLWLRLLPTSALRLFVLLVGLIGLPHITSANDQPEDLDDLLGGFEEEEEPSLPQDSSAIFEDESRFWDLTGSVSVASSINYYDHRSATGTDYYGLQKLRTRLNLQLDLDLPHSWKARFAGYGFYDFAYRIEGRDRYTKEVLDGYEWEADFQDVYLQGRLRSDLDLKLGRQIINWGRSETLRVLDVLNPLDEREPALADIEDLRLPVAMVRLDYYWGDWTLSAIAIPELRFDKLPPLGSDFNPAGSELELPAERTPSNSFDNTEWAASVMGIFHGWDLSFNFARYWDDRAHITPVPPSATNPLGLIGEHSRLMLAGAGSNYTFGSWLVKAEIAYIDGTDYTVGTFVTDPVLGTFPLAEGTVDKSRIDAMGGIEYYGIAETTIALDVVNRHINDFDDRMRTFEARRDALETALRISADFFNARLHTMALGVIFGEQAQDGSAIRLQADYELRDALLVGGGLLLFQNGDPIEVSKIDKNDRIFFELKYSF